MNEPPTRKSHSPSSVFEADIRDLFRFMGYRLVDSPLLQHEQRELLAELVAPGGIQVRILIWCRYRQVGGIGQRDVDALSLRFNALRDKCGLSRAVLVSNAYFSASARDASVVCDVDLRTPESLLASIADFQPYLRQLVDSYERSDLRVNYVPLRYCTPRQIRQLERITEPEKRSVTRAGFESLVDSELDAWVARPEYVQLLILGDYGTGKTTICRRLAYDLARAYLVGGRPNRIPLLITLRDYARGRSARQLITDFLVNTCGVSISYDAFRRLNENGLFVLILDGFDEMVARVDERVVVEMAQSLAEFHSHGSKVILTGRPGFFPTQGALNAHWPSEAPEDPYERAYDASFTGRSSRFRRMHVLPLNRTQVTQFIERRAEELQSHGDLTVQGLLDLIESTYNLSDLSERPVLLDLIVRTVPRLALEVEAINVERLYATYTSFWLDREEAKGRTLIKREDKVAFVEGLALQMFMDGDVSIHYVDLNPRIKQHFRIDEADTLDHFAHDIRSCSYLMRDLVGRYSFAHQSFMEFFVARAISREVREGRNWNFGRRVISSEVMTFLDLALSDADRNVVLDWLASAGEQNSHGGPHTTANALSLLSRRGMKFSGIALAGSKLDGIDLETIDLSGADLRRCSMRRCNLRGANLAGARMARVDLSGSDLSGATLSRAHLNRSVLTGVELTGARIDDADFGGSTLQHVRGWPKVESYRGANLAGVVGLKFEEVDIGLGRGAVGEPILDTHELHRRAKSRRRKKGKSG